MDCDVRKMTKTRKITFQNEWTLDLWVSVRPNGQNTHKSGRVPLN